MINQKKLGKVLRGLREDTHIDGKQLSIEKLSHRSGLGTTTLQSIECGRANTTLFTLGVLCDILGAKMSVVLSQCEGK